MRMSVKWLVCLSSLALLASVNAPGIYSQQASPDAIDAYIENAMRDWQIPGLAVAVVKDDSVVFMKGYGVREMGEDARVDEHTIFEITSATKSFTAAALGILVGEGKLRWDDPVTKYLPGFQLHDPYVTREMTLRDLLAHRTGLAYGSSVRDGPFDRSQLVERMRYMEPRHRFRSGFAYHHIAYLAAAEIIETVTGQSWDGFVEEQIFRPLGMSRSNTNITAVKSVENSGTPHEMVDGEMRPVEWIDRDNVGPALSINSSARDLAQWVRLHLNEGTYEGKDILTPEVIAEMQTPQTVIRLDERWRDGRPFAAYYPEANLMAHGLGWFIHDYHGRTVVEYFGRFAEIAMIPEENLGVVILMNTPADLRYALMFWLFDFYLDRPERDWSAKMLDETNAAREQRETTTENARARVEGTGPSLPLERYTGIYRDSLFGDVQILQAGEKLQLHYSPIREGSLEHWENDTFLLTWTQPRFGTSLVSFVVKSAGTITGVEVQGLTDFARVP
jgi:CubicO group peptidase (beta-lactamase class C family)